ncbi:MAG: type II secretion system F family protein [Alphaproteobacteria bacterium]|nr:type II secretion system F family protein [Alphaproteobacteria bacterium]
MRSTRLQDFRFEDWLPTGVGPDDVIALLAGLAVLVAILAIWQALRVNNSFDRRFAQIAQRKESLRRAALAAQRQREKLTPAGLMNEAVKRLNLLRSKHAADARQNLARAGMRSREAMIRYLFSRVSLPFLFGLAALGDSYGLHLIPVPQNFRFATTLAAVMFGFFAPGMYVKNVAKKRSHRLQLALPDALDLMVICAEAGLSLDATLLRVSRELESTWPDLAEELGITAAELTFLPERRLALDNLNSRTNLSSIRGVVNTLLQTAKFGTPLAQSLRVLAAEFREARMIRAEEKAARLPALLTVPMILFILPTLFIVLLGPAALNVIDTFAKR